MSRLKGITGRSKSSKTVLMASDIHDMSRMVVCSDTPYNSELDQTMKLTGLQKVLNQGWKDVAADVKDKYGKVDLMVYNGEPVDGANKKNLGQQSWTTNLEDGMQDFMKLDSLISRDKVLLVRGSNYHTTVDGTNIEEILADRMGAIRAKPWGGSGYTDAYAMVNVYGKVFNFSHHIGYSKSMAYRSTALAREMANMHFEDDKLGKIDVVVRSHVHYFWHHESVNRHGIITPAWKFADYHLFRGGVAGTTPDIGMVLAQVEPNGDIYVDKFIKDIGVKPQQVHIK